MQRLIHTVALGATLIALVAGLWQDWGTFTTLKRMAVSYLGFYFLGAVLALAVRLAGALEKDRPEPETESTSATRKA